MGMKAFSLALTFFLCRAAAEIQCDVQGECVGQIIGFTSLNASEQCLDTCIETRGCAWFTFDEREKFCNLMRTCEEVISGCESCISGEVSCKRFCGGDGLCQGVLLHTEASQSVKVCQDTCTDYDGCNFYSFDPESEQCRMFDSCQTSDLWTYCVGCISGSPGCPLEEDSDESYYLMAVGGEGNSMVEVASLDPASDPVPACLEYRNPLPDALYGAAGGLDSDGNPFVCGGQLGGETIASCYRYSPLSDTWEQTGSLSAERKLHAFGSSPSWGLVMAGGTNDGGSLSVAETTRDSGENTTLLRPLPRTVEQFCLVVIDEDRVFVAGGLGAAYEAYVFTKSTDSWTSGAAMPRARNSHRCGLVVDAERGPEIVAVGGTGASSDTVDIYTVDSYTWREGNDLPTSIWDAAVVQYKDSFLLVGGHDPSVGATRDVYQYDAANDDWIKLETQLKYQRSDHVALLVEKSMFPQCT